MRVRFYIDPESERPHVENHGITTLECVQVLERARHDFAGQRGARLAFGPTSSGRVLKVVYTLDQEIFVITAYPLRGKELKAYRRRVRRH